MNTKIIVGLGLVMLAGGVIAILATNETQDAQYNTSDSSVGTGIEVDMVSDRGDGARRAQKDNKDASTLQNDLDAINNP